MRTDDGVVFVDGRGAVEAVEVHKSWSLKGAGNVRGDEMSPVRGVDGDATAENSWGRRSKGVDGGLKVRAQLVDAGGGYDAGIGGESRVSSVGGGTMEALGSKALTKD